MAKSGCQDFLHFLLAFLSDLQSKNTKTLTLLSDKRQLIQQLEQISDIR